MVQGDESGVEGFVAVCLLVENGLVVDRGEAVDEGDGVGGHGGDRRVVKIPGERKGSTGHISWGVCNLD